MSPSIASENGVTGEFAKVQLGSAPPVDSEARAAKAGQHGWVKPQRYDYDTYNKDDNASREGAIDPSGYSSASRAVRYEWSEEHGEVAPAFPELEEELFGGEYHMTQGDRIQALWYKVTVEGVQKPDVCEKVSLNLERLFTCTQG
jgi:hypothetical protein